MKLLIVDDDVLVRVALKTMIDWDGGEFQLAGEAENGEMALSMLQETPVDLVITDMKMPVMDGIELIRSLKKLPTVPDILVLSNYDDYDLVREALKLGVEDYLLKINIEAEALNFLLNNYAASHKVGKNEEFVSPQKMAMRQELLLKSVIWGVFEEDDIREAMKECKIRLYDTCPGCLILKVNELYLFEDVPYERLYEWSQSVISLSIELLGNLFYAYCLEIRTGEFVILISGKHTSIRDISEKDFWDTLDNLREMLWQYLNITVTIGVGIGENGIAGILTSVQRAKEALQRHYFETGKPIVVNQTQKAMEGESQLMPSVSILGRKKEFHDSLLYHQKEKLKEFFEEIIKLLECSSISRSDIVNLLIEIFSITYEFFEVYQLEAPQWKHKVMYWELLFVSGRDHAKKLIEQLQDELIIYVEQIDDSYYYGILQQVREYLEAHYAEDISLQETAFSVNMNPSYLSGILKKYIGKSYIEYLIDLRIEEAKRLLLSSNLKIYEIGERVGYDNMYYFNRIFKKMTGMPPGDFRKYNKNSGKVQNEREKDK